MHISDSHHHAASVISKILGIKDIHIGYKDGAPSKRSGWTAIHRKNTSNNQAFYNQWYIGDQDPIKLIASKSGYIKPPTPSNIANAAPNTSGTIVLTKQKLVTSFRSEVFSTLSSSAEDEYVNPGYLSSRDSVIKGMIGYPFDEDYIKILLDAGDYKLQQIHLPHSMLDIRLELLDPRIEVPKNKNKLNTSSIKSECANKIYTYPNLPGSSECFGLDKTPAGGFGISPGVLIDSNPSEKPAAISFKLKKRTFVYLKVSPRLNLSQKLSNNYQADVGKYAIALINTNKKNVSNDITYPSCYMNWALNPDPVAVPERKLSRIKILQNGAVKDVAFYLQEKEDETKGALIIPKKFNTVVNGKLIEQTSSNAIKYIIDNYEYSLYGYPKNNNERFRLFAPSIKKAGEFSQIEFIAGGIYETTENEAFTGWNSDGGFITDWSDAASSATNYSKPPDTTQGVPLPTPTPTPTPTLLERHVD